MTKNITYIPIILTLFSSCLGPCETMEEWNVDTYTIKKQKCPDMVSKSYTNYSVYIGDEIQERTGARKDSCTITWQAKNDRFLTLNICENRVTEINPRKNLLDFKKIDSVLIYSNAKGQFKQLTSEQIQKFTADWNKSKIRGYSEKQFDSAFHFFPAYQYKLTLFSESKKTEFYGYNYLILDNSNWKYEMSEFGDLEYFNGYWNE